MTPAQLRMARALLQLGMRELAEKAGVNKMSVQRMENGRRAHPPTVEKIKAALIEMGIIFIGAMEPLYEETVALRWGMEPPRVDDDQETDEDNQEDGDIQSRAWDEEDA
jgi:transcriptional regulator with XRE-family HTH domain